MNMSCSSSLKGSVVMSGRSTVAVSFPAPVDDFPAGLRVLVVDDDPTCLAILERMLKACRYRVTKCNRAEIALAMLRENKNGYDVVISDVHMPDMDGFKLLEHIGLEMDLPVIMMSADDSKDVVMKGVTHGACDYLIKPVRIEALKNIWQHVIRKKQTGWKDLEQSGSVEEGDRQQKPCDEADYSSSANEGSWRNSKKKREEEDEPEDRDDSSTLKKPRVVWSVELHQQFVGAVNQLGIDKAVPKKILELMNVPGLTRENVASHLQKYRLYLRRLSGVSQHPSNVNNSFMSHQETAFGPMSSLNGIDLQSLAATGQLAVLQAAGLGRSTVKPHIPMPLADQRNIFSFENPRFRSVEGHQQNMGSVKQMNLLHGIPTSMEPKQFANMHQSAHSLGNMNVQASGHPSQSSSLLMPMANSQPRMPMANSQPRMPMLNETNSNHIPQAPTSVGQPIVSNGVSVGTLSRNTIGDNGRRMGYNPVSQPSPVLNFPMNPSTELPVNSFPLGSTPGLPNFASKSSFQDDVNLGIKGSGGFAPSYDIFSDLQQHRSNDWELQNVENNYSASQQLHSIPGNIDASQSVFVNQGYSSGQNSVQNRNASSVGKAIFSAGEGIEHGNAKNIVQNYSNHLDNPVQVKTEMVSNESYQTTHTTEAFGEDDLMSILLKQQQGGSGQTGNEFDFDGFSLDNIPV